MYVKKLVDDIRRDFDFNLSLNRYRDLIARIIFGRPYSATIAAERAGKLAPPKVDDDLVESLREGYGRDVSDLARVAHRHVNALTFAFSYLRPIDVFEVASISARRMTIEAPEEYRLGDYLDASPDSPLGQKRQARIDLEDRIAQLDYDALVELKALMLLGRGDSGDDYAGVLAYSKMGRDDHIPEYLAAKLTLHWMLADGLRMVGKPGEAILALYPAMHNWSRHHAKKEDGDESFGLSH
ncbi:DUF3775 domain-containing protein [Luteibacter sp. 3190]|uniref:DUF3775 domain-containing protein n=1 Tax=Luteibacter sp. 3190 TaxID=2817736 RepID=UPI00285E70E8|nr:DUF3775 domain-containing protein [Luteibacter sp. 3190]MDR6935347.1 hypothetical protein [Luteibacter sp. 3190]